MVADQKSNALEETHERGTWLRKHLGPMAMDLEDLRQVARHMAAQGTYSVRRFDELFGSLEEFLQAYEAPYRHIIFISPTMEVRLSSAEASIFYAPEASEEGEAMEALLEGYVEPPLVRFRYLHLGILFAVAVLAGRWGHFTDLMLSFVVLALYLHAVEETMNRKPVLRRTTGLLRDGRTAFAFVVGAVGLLGAVSGFLSRFLG